MTLLRRLVLHWCAPLLFGLAVCCPAAHAQRGDIGRAADQDHGASNEEGTGKTPALQYAVAVLFTLGVLVIVCMPSRKN